MSHKKEMAQEERNFYSIIQLSDNKYIDNDGSLVCKNAILGKAGVQSYSGYELGLDSDTIISVERPHDEVFNDQSLASLKGKTLTLGHPDEDVSIDNHKYLSKGFVLDVWQDGDYIRGNIKVTDKEMIDIIKNKEMVELSLGYEAKLKYVSDSKLSQKNISYNHLALVKRGRAEVARVVDESKVRLMDSLLDKEKNKMELTKEEVVELVKNTIQTQKDEELKAEEKRVAEEEKRLSDEKAKEEAEEKRLNDEKVKEEEAEKQKLADEKAEEERLQKLKDTETEKGDEDMGDIKRIKQKLEDIKDIEDVEIRDSLRAQLMNEINGITKDDSALNDFGKSNIKDEEPNTVNFDKEFKTLIDRLNPHNYDSFEDYRKERKKIEIEGSKSEVISTLEELDQYGGNQ